MPIHGLVMAASGRLTRAGADESGAAVECEWCDDANTRSLDPFGVAPPTASQICGGKLRTTVRVFAAMSSNALMPFSLGNHISIGAPLADDGLFEKMTILAAADAVKLPTPLSLAGDAGVGHPEFAAAEIVALQNSRPEIFGNLGASVAKICANASHAPPNALSGRLKKWV
jgi:hypothetical protein